MDQINTEYFPSALAKTQWLVHLGGGIYECRICWAQNPGPDIELVHQPMCLHALAVHWTNMRIALHELTQDPGKSEGLLDETG